MRRTKKRWRSCGTKYTHCGFLVKNKEEVLKELDPCKNNQYLTNLRFADDLLIIAKSKEELSKMMSVLKEECHKVGLEMHNIKTQVLTNGIKEKGDDRRLILKQLDDKIKGDKKTKEEKKQIKIERQRNKSKKIPNKSEAELTTLSKPKKKICKKKKSQKEHDKAKANPKVTSSKNSTKEKDTAENCTKKQQSSEKQSPKKIEAVEADNMLLKDGTAIRILKPHEHVKYFGKQLNLINHTDRDIEERIRKGWIKFSEFRPQLCAKGVSKKQKWLLFESVITSTVLYGSCSWTMNNERRAKLLSAQSKMVRQMLGLQWWKSTAKWEAEQQMDDLKESVQDGLLKATDEPGHAKSNHNEQHSSRIQPKWTRQTQRTSKPDTKKLPSRSGRQSTQQHTLNKSTRRKSSPSESSSTSSSTDTSERKTRFELKEDQATEKKKIKLNTIYANWMQETAKECKKELQKHKVTNWVNGQRSRQFGMAGHVIRKTDGRWSNALINWYEGKPVGKNTTNQYWEHDIEAWIKKKFPGDHSTWQQLAKDPDKWTKWRDEYAADWPNKHRGTIVTNTSVNQRSTNQRLDQTTTSRPSTNKGNADTEVQRQTLTLVMERTEKDNHYQKDDQEDHTEPKTVPVPGGRKRITILMKPRPQSLPISTLSTTVIPVAGCCPHSWGERIQPRHW